MHERFLEGKDYEYFKYGEIDDNEDYDDKKIIA